jgi:glycerophosphoryl diester phosphodiesterase
VVAGHEQNTLGSFAAAAALGVPWVEVDVRRTADDELVVAHDPVDADGAWVADLTSAQTDECGVLRLRDLLAALPPGVGVDLDLKSAMPDSGRTPDRTTAGLLAPVAAAELARRPLMVTSFDPAALQHVRAAAPEVPLGWLTWQSFPLEAAVAGCAHLDVEALAVHVGSFTDPRTGQFDAALAARAVALVHDCGKELLVWCPDPALTRQLADAGADAVVVDQVPRAWGQLHPAA